MNFRDTFVQLVAHGRSGEAAALVQRAAQGDPSSTAEAAAVLVQLYRDLHVPEVRAFRQEAEAGLDPQLALTVLRPLMAEKELDKVWAKRLAELSIEHFTNDLVTYIKANDLERALACVQSLMAHTVVPEHRAARAKMIANVCGTLLHEKDRALALVRKISRAPQTFGIDALVATDMEEEFNRSSTAAARRERDVGSLSRTELTQAAVELGRLLPGRNVMAEATPEAIETFESNLRAIARCAVFSPNHHLLHEATLLLTELAPKDVSAAGAAAGMEQRLYANLGRTARVVASHALGALGQVSRFFDPYIEYARKHRTERHGKLCCEMLGLLKNEAAVPLLIENLKDHRLDSRPETIQALGTIGSPAAVKALLMIVEADLRGKVYVGDKRRDAILTLGALARCARTLPGHLRSEITARVIKLLPPNDSELMLRVALNFFAGKIEEIDSQLLEWAAGAAVGGLWNIDRPEFARAARQAPLGFKQLILDLLERLAPRAYDAINKSAMEHASHYGGAYYALGEFYAKVPDARAIPVIRQLITNTFLRDTSAPKSAYVKEMMTDVETEQQIEITADKVLGSLIYAADKIGGDEADSLLGDLFDQAQAGRLPRLGREASDLLMQAAMRRGQQPLTQQGAPEAGGAEIESTMPSLTESDHLALRDLDAHYLLPGKRRMKMVAAMATLAQHRVIPAIDKIIAHLADKDALVAAAAVTALTDYATPPVSQTVFNRLCDHLLQVLARGNDAARQKSVEVLQRLKPQAPPLKEKLEALAGHPGLDVRAQAAIARLTGEIGGGKSAVHRLTREEQEKLGEVKKFLPAKASAPVTDMDKKRAYMLARQEWIKNGKRGPEPTLPE